MTNKEKALEMHKQWNGKLSVEAKCQVASAEDLAIAYTPGVAEPCRAIAKNPKEAYTYTIKSNTVAVVSDGSAVLVVNGAGSAGIAIAKMLLSYGFKDLTLCDRQGILCSGDPSLNWMQEKMTQITNLSHKTGTLADAMKGADIFVGVSAPGIISQDMVRSMAKDSILFTMANPDPEILPHLAKEAGAKVVGTGRSDFPNQVNNVLVFPGIFKGALEGHSTHITSEMKLAAAHAIAGLVPAEELSDTNILPHAFDPQIADVVSAAVKEYID